MPVVTRAGRLHVPLTVHDALRRGDPDDAARSMRQANPALSHEAAHAAIRRLAANPSDRLDDEDPFQPAPGAAPAPKDVLPSDVAAKIATGNTRDAARRLREAKPGLSEVEAREAVARHCSPLLREAREETVVRGDSGRYGWLVAVLAVILLGGGLAIWLG